MHHSGGIKCVLKSCVAIGSASKFDDKILCDKYVEGIHPIKKGKLLA